MDVMVYGVLCVPVFIACLLHHRELTPAESDMEFLTIAKDLPRFGKHLFQATVSGILPESCCRLSNSFNTIIL